MTNNINRYNELREKLSVILFEADYDEPKYNTLDKLERMLVDRFVALFTHQLELSKVAYHNEITDNEKKIWLYKEDYDKRIELAKIEAKIEELKLLTGWVVNDSTIKLYARHERSYADRLSELKKKKDLLTKEDK